MIDIIRKLAIIDVSSVISEEDYEKILNAIKLSGLDLTPEEVLSAALTALLIFIGLSVIVFLITWSFALVFSIVAIGLFLFYYIKNYPILYLKRLRSLEYQELFLMIFFIVTYMRMNPNLEKALEFASRNLSGIFGKKLKKLFWDLQSRKFTSAKEVLIKIGEEYEEDIPELMESIRLIIASTYEVSEERRLDLLDRAIERMLEGSYDRANRSIVLLKQPLNVVYMLGIILPVLVTVMLPIFSIFAGESIGLDVIFSIYNVFLPIVLIMMSQNILVRRPVFFQKAFQKSEKWPKKWCIRIFDREINIFLIFSIILLATWLVPLIYFTIVGKGKPNTMLLYLSFLPSFITILLISVLSRLYFSQRESELKEIETAEKDFVDVAFQIGHRIAEGLPAEHVLQNLKTKSKFFSIIVDRIKRMGLSLEDACFHPNYGVFRFFSSPILLSGMMLLIESIKKSYREASSVMINFSRHLRNIERTETRIKDLLGEILSEMKFNANYIIPVLLGVVIGITSLIVVVLYSIQEQVQLIFASAGNVEEQFGSGFLMGMLSIVEKFSLASFQLIMFLYFLSVILIISYILAEIEYPGQEYYFFKNVSEILIISGIIYILVGLGTSFAFVSIAKVALKIGGVMS